MSYYYTSKVLNRVLIRTPSSQQRFVGSLMRQKNCASLSTSFLSGSRYSSTATPSNATCHGSTEVNGIRVGYITDLEGDYDYWCKYLSYSKVFNITPLAARDASKLQDNTTASYKGYTNPYSIEFSQPEKTHFVFGGDLWDRNNGDIRLLIDMITLKRKYPNNVHFILGNRDVNKLRLPYALAEGVLQSKQVEEYGNVYWFRKNNQLLENAKTSIKPGDTASKLRWILSSTMGAPIAFQSRQSELQVMGLSASDIDVVNSYLHLLSPSHPDNLMLEYLAHGEIAVAMGDVLFIHGGLHENALGWVPPLPEKDTNEQVFDLKQWIEKVNNFAKTEVEDYRQNSVKYINEQLSNGSKAIEGKSITTSLWEINGGYDSPQPGSRLLQYAMGSVPVASQGATKADPSTPAAVRANPTVIYSSYLKNGQLPLYASQTVAEFLESARIHRVIVGHQPHGDSPWVMRLYNSLEILCVDSAYSMNTLWPKTTVEKQARKMGLLPASAAVEAMTAADDEDLDYENCDYISYHGYLRSQASPDTPSQSQPQTFSEKNTTRSNVVQTDVVIYLQDHSDPNNSNTEHLLKHGHSRVQVAGTLSDGFSSYEYELGRFDKSGATSGFIGHLTRDRWFVKAANVVSGSAGGENQSKKYFLLSKVNEKKPFHFQNRLIEQSKLIEELYDFKA